MLEFDWDNSVGYWICTTSHTLRRALSTRLAEEKMTLRQWEVLAWLSRKGELSQTQLAECLGIEPHTLTGVVTRMERDGWLKRVPCPTDRRRFSVHPTPRAETVWARAAEWCHEVRQQALIGFSDAEIRSFKGMCERIQQNLGPEATAGADSDCLTAEIVIEPQPEESVPAVS
ncbi:MAG: MarR family transcriptional regulator [Planctomyces sp.]|nr:MarR family transcriptional regulator [Planctomyces sp.]